MRVSLLLAISVTYETIRQWGLKFGREFANRIRRRAPQRGDKWHLDEVVITIAGKKHWLATRKFSEYTTSGILSELMPPAEIAAAAAV
jgi:hypothetical protein